MRPARVRRWHGRRPGQVAARADAAIARIGHPRFGRLHDGQPAPASPAPGHAGKPPRGGRAQANPATRTRRNIRATRAPQGDRRLQG